MQTLLQTHFLQPKETAQDIWRQILGLEDPNPNKIDGKALRNRQRLIKAFSEIGKIGRREVKLTAEDIEHLHKVYLGLFALMERIPSRWAWAAEPPHVFRADE